jgi:hypothetical protein
VTQCSLVERYKTLQKLLTFGVVSPIWQLHGVTYRPTVIVIVDIRPNSNLEDNITERCFETSFGIDNALSLWAVLHSVTATAGTSPEQSAG